MAYLMPRPGAPAQKLRSQSVCPAGAAHGGTQDLSRRATGISEEKTLKTRLKKNFNLALIRVKVKN